MTDFIRLTPRERAIAYPSSALAPPAVTTSSVADDGIRESPREALDALLERALTSPAAPPLHVLFSGGRDSSAMLALATSVARRIGADDPVPVTVRHPDAPESHETEWQELVLSHLGLDQHRVLEFRGEQSWLGDAAREGIARHGLLWPPSMHLHGAVYRELEAGAVVSGEGGDLIIEQRRISPLVEAVRNRWVRTSVRRGVDVLRARRRTRELADAIVARASWMTEAGASELRAALTEPAERLRWERALGQVVRGRQLTMAQANYAAVARAYGQEPLSPFEEPRFVAALRRAGGWWGLGSRTDMMRYLFSDLLPDAVLARPTKAAFNSTRWLEGEREFARSWSGVGVDTELVDPERLRAEWLRERPSTLSATHLHAAWLAEHERAGVARGA